MLLVQGFPPPSGSQFLLPVPVLPVPVLALVEGFPPRLRIALPRLLSLVAAFCLSCLMQVH